MQVTNSADIQVLDFEVLLDISGASPVLTITNLSTMANPANLDWAFEILSPSGTPVHSGNFTTPDVDGVWNTPFVKNSNFPKPAGQIEWGTFNVKVQVKDALGVINGHTKPVKICRPSGNKPENKNTFGAAHVELMVRCKEAQVFFQDTTSYSYQGIAGVAVTKTLRMINPANETGAGSSTLINNFSSILVPIIQTGPGYQYFQVSVMDYLLGDNVTVRVKYIGNNTFNVSCNLDLTPIACELNKLISDVQNGSCADAKVAEKNISIVSAKLHVATVGIMFPLSGIDPYKTIEEIKDITGWECECCPSGVTPMASIASNNMAYLLTGNIAGQFSIQGDTVVLNLEGATSEFSICPDNEIPGFEIIPTVDGGLTKYCFKTSRDLVANSILTYIQSNTALLNLLNSMMVVGVSNVNVTVDGKCVIENRDICDYIFSSVALGVTDMAQIISIHLEDGTVKSVNYIFDQTNAAAVKAALDALNIGTFVVAMAGGKMEITSVANPNAITKIIYRTIDGGVTSVDRSIDITKVCVPGATIPLGTFAQKMIDFVCGMILGQIKTGKGLSINILRVLGGVVETLTVSSDKSALYLIEAILDSYNKLVEVVRGIPALSCDALKVIFTDSGLDPTIVPGHDVLYGTIGKQCHPVTYEKLAARIFTIAQQDQVVKNLFCQASLACATPVCAPVANMTAVYNPGTSVLSGVITNTGALKYSIGYRLFGETVHSMLLGVQEVTAVVGATTPYSFAAVPAGTWEVVVEAICASGNSAPFSAYSADCSALGSFSVTENSDSFTVNWAVIGAPAKVRIEVGYPNGGSFVQNYNIAPATATIPKPSGIYGTFTFVGRAVCDEAAAWYGPKSNPVEINVAAPSTCPAITALVISAIGTTGATFDATKPTTGAVPNSYTLRLTPQGGGASRNYTKNQVGATVQWVINDLTAGTVYAVETISECTSGPGDPYVVPSFATLTAGGNNTTITNSTPLPASSVSTMIDNVLVHYVAPLAAAAVSNTVVPNYTTVTVKVVPCDSGADTGTITSDGITYNLTRMEGEALIFENVTIVNGMDIVFDTI